jgi:hypothetical protein
LLADHAGDVVYRPQRRRRLIVYRSNTSSYGSEERRHEPEAIAHLDDLGTMRSTAKVSTDGVASGRAVPQEGRVAVGRGTAARSPNDDDAW